MFRSCSGIKIEQIGDGWNKFLGRLTGIANFGMRNIEKGVDPVLDEIANNILEEIKKACSLTAYVLDRRPNSKKWAPLTPQRYVMNVKQYITQEGSKAEAYINPNRYLNLYNVVRKRRSFPYSRMRPHPPAPPQFINIQTGELLAGFQIKRRKGLLGKREVAISNNSIHFYFIASSASPASKSRMMKRPLLDHINAFNAKLYAEKREKLRQQVQLSFHGKDWKDYYTR